MFSISLLKKSFDHGVHPKHHKAQTAGLSIQRVPFVSRYVMPLGQHIGAPAKPVVEKKDEVKVGQVVAEAGGFVSAPVHATISGVVKEIAPHPHPVSGRCNAIVIGRVVSSRSDSGVMVGDPAFVGAPMQIATAALYLSTPDSSFMNGEVITVDGGSSVLATG